MKKVIRTCFTWIFVAILSIATFVVGGSPVYAATSISPGLTYERATAVAINTEYLADSNLAVQFYKFELQNDAVVSLDFKMSAVPSANAVGSVAGATTEIDYGYYTFFNISNVELYSNTNSSGAVGMLTSAVGDGGYVMSAITDANLHTSKKIGLGKGTYYFAVANVGCKATSYTFNIRTSTETCAWESEYNGNYTIADALDLQKEYKGTNSTVMDADYYKFSLTQNAFITITLGHDYQTGSKKLYTVTLYDANQAAIMSFSSNVNDTVVKRSIGLSGVATGSAYYIRIAGGSSDTGYYSLKVDADTTCLCETENNGSFDTADEIVTEKDIIGTNTSAYDVLSLTESTLVDNDYYKFTTAKKGVISLTLTHAAVAENHTLVDKALYTVNLYDKDKNIIYTFTSAYGELTTKSLQIGLQAGTYYVSVIGKLADSGIYTLKVNYKEKDNWECESNDTADTANSIKSDKTYNGSLHSATDVDFFKIKMSKNGSLSFKFMQELVKGSTSSTCYKVNLYSAEDLSSSIYELKVKGEDTSIKSPTIGLAKGTYYVKVQSVVYVTQEYKIKVTTTASEYYEREYNDITSQATNIKLGKNYTGSIRANDDVDYYKFKVTKSGSVTLKFMQDLVKGYTTSTCYKVKLYKASDTSEVIYEMKVKGEDTSIKSPTIGLKKGTYYLKVQSVVFTSHDYQIKVQNAESELCEKETNDSVSSANTIKSGKTYTGSIRSTDDVDYFKIKMTKKGYLTINLKQSDTSESSIYRLYLYNSDRDELYQTVIKGNQNNFNSGKIGLKKGTYYVMLKAYAKVAYTGDYQLTVTTKSSKKYETEPNNTLESANKIAIGTEVKATSLKKSTGLYEHYDYYKLTVKDTTEIKVSLSHKKYSGSDTMWDVYILDKDGNHVNHQTDYVSSRQKDKKVTTNTIKLKKGTYYIEVYAHAVAADKEYSLLVEKN